MTNLHRVESVLFRRIDGVEGSGGRREGTRRWGKRIVALECVLAIVVARRTLRRGAIEAGVRVLERRERFEGKLRLSGLLRWAGRRSRLLSWRGDVARSGRNGFPNDLNLGRAVRAGIPRQVDWANSARRRIRTVVPRRPSTLSVRFHLVVAVVVRKEKAHFQSTKLCVLGHLAFIPATLYASHFRPVSISNASAYFPNVA